MAYQNPVSKNTYHASNPKFSDGKSVRVTVGGDTTISAGEFVVLSGYAGFAVQEVSTGTGESADLIITIEQAEYITDKLASADAFNTVGALVYHDPANDVLTTDSAVTNARLVGKLTDPRDSNDNIAMLLLPQQA